MGLFGFFASMFGLGGMAKNYIDDTMKTFDSQEKAYENNDPYYFSGTGVGSKRISTDTGRECDVMVVNGHQVVYDKRTYQTIRDLTKEENDRKTREFKREDTKDGCKFYRTAEHNMRFWHNDNVYANDDMPGRYFIKKNNDNKLDIGKEYVGEYFSEVEVEYYCPNNNERNKRFRLNQIEYRNSDGKITGWDDTKYLANGEVLTEEKENEIVKQQAKEHAIKEGKVFYEYKNFEHKDIKVATVIKRVDEDNDTLYYHHRNFSADEDYYTPAALKSREVLVAPHRSTETKIVYYLVPDPERKSEKYWPDGTKWIDYDQEEDEWDFLRQWSSNGIPWNKLDEKCRMNDVHLNDSNYEKGNDNGHDLNYYRELLYTLKKQINF